MFCHCLSDQEDHSVQEIKNYLAQKGIDGYTEGQFAGSITTLQRNGTIRKIDRGVYSIRKRAEDMRKCFVICPIGEEGSETRINSDKLLKYIISPVCEACDIKAKRVDQQNDANSITQTIIESLETADLVIADISGHNPNVFYEMGYRARTQKPMIHLRRKGENIPFDVNTIRTLDYDLTDLDSVDEVKDRLKKTIESFHFNEVVEAIAEETVVPEPITPAIMPVLYQILDRVGELESAVKSFSPETIGSIVKSMQSVQPQATPDPAMQNQLVSSLVQNPEGFVMLMELADKMSKNKIS